jgi:uncharacterized protein YndB with AHSA1/START domain
MAPIAVSAEREVDARPAVVYNYIADMRQHHPRFLPPAFSDFEVESGGVGAGTVTRFKLKVGGRTREINPTIAEPEPGRVLTETDANSSSVVTFTVTPQARASLVNISCTWNGARGVEGFFERLFAPSLMRKLLTDELIRLNAYARERGGS